ncbi:MAG: HAMP domain-containing histidine kinase [Oscillospiraceae bacterium]|jgi:signal transduction histidine kinase|nr:HAMP domain-containing histidine kinase [Oscillospiraceae bacterium]
MFKKTRNRIMLLNMIMVSTVVIAAFAAVFIISFIQIGDSNRERLLQLSMSRMSMIVSSEFAPGDSLINHSRSFSIRENEGFTESDFFIDSDSYTESSTFSGTDHIIDGEFSITFDADNFWNTSLIRPDYGISFSLLADMEGNLVRISSGIDLPEEAYEQAAFNVINSNTQYGVTTLEGRRWQYDVSSINLAFGILDEYESDALSREYNNIHFMDITDSYNMLVSLALTLSGLTLVILVAFLFISRYFANRAIHPMENAFERQSRFIADASHELKTPLSVINANCGVLYSNKDETMDSQIKWVDSIMRASTRMNGLVRDMLSLASIDEAETNLIIEKIRLNEIIEDAVLEIEPAALEKGINIKRSIEPDMIIENDKEHVLKIANIFLDNAVKYTNVGGSISVSLYNDKRTAVLSVRNTGDGIPQDDLERVFDRFYRSDASRSSQSGDYGLGLAIAKAAAECIGAKLSAKSTQGEYTQFNLVL